MINILLLDVRVHLGDLEYTWPAHGVSSPQQLFRAHIFLGLRIATKSIRITGRSSFKINFRQYRSLLDKAGQLTIRLNANVFWPGHPTGLGLPALPWASDIFRGPSCWSKYAHQAAVIPHVRPDDAGPYKWSTVQVFYKVWKSRNVLNTK